MNLTSSRKSHNNLDSLNESKTSFAVDFNAAVKFSGGGGIPVDDDSDSNPYYSLTFRQQQ